MPLEVLYQYLGPRRCLLVLDNFEHVLDTAPEVAELLGSCPHLCVLVTSRALEGQGRARVQDLPPGHARPRSCAGCQALCRAGSRRLSRFRDHPRKRGRRGCDLLEKLEEAGEAKRLHARYYLALAEEAESRVKGPDQVEWLDKLEAENHNLRAAIGNSLEMGDAQTAARFGWALSMYWLLRARQGEGRLLIEPTLERAEDLPTQTRARALNALAVCMYGSGTPGGSSRYPRRAQPSSGRPGMIGFAMLEMGELDGATRIFGEVLENLRGQGHAWASAHILNHMAVAPLRRGDFPRAAEYAQEALALTEQTGDRLAAQTSLQILAQAAWASGEYREASRYFEASLWVASELADRVNAAYCMQGLAAVAGPIRAVRLLGAAETLLEEAAVPLYAWADHGMQQQAANAARERLGKRAWTAAHETGRAMTFEEALAYALREEAPPP